ncbi:MAG: hypothetical protein ACYSU0_10710 [Planctomycetota bacterium]|jgi:hypothetical protein
MDSLGIRVKAALIRGESPGRVARELESEGVPRQEIDRLLGENSDIVASQARRKRKRTLARLGGAAVFLPALAFNIYYLCFWQAGWVISGASWAIMLYGLMVILSGDFGAGLGPVFGGGHAHR